jgi:hypothetical protein
MYRISTFGIIKKAETVFQQALVYIILFNGKLCVQKLKNSTKNAVTYRNALVNKKTIYYVPKATKVTE